VVDRIARIGFDRTCSVPVTVMGRDEIHFGSVVYLIGAGFDYKIAIGKTQSA